MEIKAHIKVCVMFLPCHCYQWNRIEYPKRHGETRNECRKGAGVLSETHWRLGNKYFYSQEYPYERYPENRSIRCESNCRSAACEASPYRERPSEIAASHSIEFGDVRIFVDPSIAVSLGYLCGMEVSNGREYSGYLVNIGTFHG